MMKPIVINRNGRPSFLTSHGLTPLYGSGVSASASASASTSAEPERRMGTSEPAPRTETVLMTPVMRHLRVSEGRSLKDQMKLDASRKEKEEERSIEKEDDEVLSALSAISLKYGMGGGSKTAPKQTRR